MKPHFVFVSLAACAHAFGQSLDLNQALTLARESRPAVTAASSAVSSALEATRAAGSRPPLVMGIGATSKEGLGATDQDLFLGHSPDFYGRASAARRVAESAHRRALAGQREVWLDVQAEVLSAYIEAYSAGRQSVAAGALLDVGEALFQATQRRFEEGKIPEVQLSLASIQRDRARQAADHAKSKELAALQRLAGAMGVWEAPRSLAPPALTEPPALVDQRPDIMALLAEVDAAEAEALVAARDATPELDLSALRSPWGESAPQVAMRVQLTWRLGDFGKTRSLVRAARERSASLNSRVEDLRRRAASELVANKLEVESARTRLDSAEAIRRAAVELASKSQRGFAEGIGSLLDVLEATRALRDIEVEVVDAEREYLLAMAARFAVAGTLLEAGS
ncbi:MAG: TolC family protein [Nitrospirae bacterium]|nr:TolC family protein [Fimbriimonadaceae bacterium]